MGDTIIMPMANSILEIIRSIKSKGMPRSERRRFIHPHAEGGKLKDDRQFHPRKGFLVQEPDVPAFSGGFNCRDRGCLFRHEHLVCTIASLPQDGDETIFQTAFQGRPARQSQARIPGRPVFGQKNIAKGKLTRFLHCEAQPAYFNTALHQGGRCATCRAADSARGRGFQAFQHKAGRPLLRPE